MKRSKSIFTFGCVLKQINKIEMEENKAEAKISSRALHGLGDVRLWTLWTVSFDMDTDKHEYSRMKVIRNQMFETRDSSSKIQA